MEEGYDLKRILRVAAILAACLSPSFAQGLPGMWSNQFFDNSGKPLSGGRIFTCQAGAACPGTPQATYTDSSLFSANANPVLLGTSGRPQSGSNVVGIWLTTGLSYKFVVQNSAGTTIFTVDNVAGVASSGGGGSGNYWTLTGSTITNNNGGGSGDVVMAANASVGTNLSIAQSLKLQTSGAQYAILRAATSMASDITWRWAATDVAGPLCSDGLGNLAFGTCGGGGGGGTPGGVNTNVQFNNLGSFGGSANFFWNNSTQLLTVNATGSGAAGIAVGTGYMQADAGFLATSGTCNSFNCLQAPTGGLAGRSITASKYIQAGNSSGAPTVTSGDTFAAGALYWDTMSSAMQVYDGSGWISLGGGTGSPGGSNTNVQYNSGGSFAGSANFFWNNATRLLTVNSAAPGNAGIAVGTGYIQADAGFLATPATATSFNVIQAPGGGMSAKNFTATAYIQSGNGAGTPSIVAGDTFVAGALFYNTTSGCEQVYNGSSWSCLGAGGGGTPGGVNTNVQFNNSGTFGGSSNFFWNNTTRLLTINALASGAGLAVGGGYVQADIGFLATTLTATTFNAIQAPGGGMAAKNFTATTYVQTGRSSGAPTPTSGDTIVAGAMYWDTGLTVERVFNGSTWVSLSGSGGVSSLNALTGALNIACAAASSCSVGASGATVTITAPQPLATTSNVNFATSTTIGQQVSSATGASLTFGNANGLFLVRGDGIVSAISLNLNGGTGTGLNVTANTDSNSIQTRGGVAVCNAGTCASGNAFAINGTQVMTDTGFWIGHVNTPLSGSNIFYTGPSGNFYDRAISGLSTSVSCSGVADGWMAITLVDNYLVTCIANARYRASLTFF